MEIDIRHSLEPPTSTSWLLYSKASERLPPTSALPPFAPSSPRSCSRSQASEGPHILNARSLLARGPTCGTDATMAIHNLAYQSCHNPPVSPVFPFHMCPYGTTPYYTRYNTHLLRWALHSRTAAHPKTCTRLTMSHTILYIS